MKRVYLLIVVLLAASAVSFIVNDCRLPWPRRRAPPFIAPSRDFVGLPRGAGLPPSLNVTQPRDLSTTVYPGIRVAGTVSEQSGTVRVFINGEWADGISGGKFWYDRFPLEPGTNLITVLATNLVGRFTQQQVRVIHDFSNDTNAPNVSL